MIKDSDFGFSMADLLKQVKSEDMPREKLNKKKNSKEKKITSITNNKVNNLLLLDKPQTIKSLSNILKLYSKNIVDQLNHFLQHLEIERNYSKLTIEIYRRNLLYSLVILANKRIINEWSELDTELLSYIVAESYKKINKKDKKPMSAKSQRQRIASISSLFKWLIRNKITNINPCKLIKLPKVPHSLPKEIELHKLEKILDYSEDELKEFCNVRDLAIFELLYNTGMRVSELQSLNINNIDFSNNEIRIIGKGNKERIVPVGDNCLEIIRKYINHLKLFEKYDGVALFISERKQRISVRQIQNRLRFRAIKVGIIEKVTPHKLRHSFATHILQRSGNLRAVQEMLGHESLSSTQVYTTLNIEHLCKVHKETHPSEKKKLKIPT